MPEGSAAGQRGRITIYCVAENLDRKALELRLRERGGNYLIQQYPDVLYGQVDTGQVRLHYSRGGGWSQMRQAVPYVWGRGRSAVDVPTQQVAGKSVCAHCRRLAPCLLLADWPGRLRLLL